MADPLSISASLVAVVTAALQSTTTLYETVKRYKGRDKTLLRLENELGDLKNILHELTAITDNEQSIFKLLRGPVERCSQVCKEFEQSMESFRGKSKTGFRDWTKLEFMKGDINEFIDTVAGYKSTIAIGLGTITLRTSKVSHKVLEEYNETIQDTTYNLELRLQRIDDKMTELNIKEIDGSNLSIDLKDEKEVTRQCLSICENARSYIRSLSRRQSDLLSESYQNAAEEKIFEAQTRTRQALNENTENLAETIGHLRKRLASLIQDDSPGSGGERSRLQADIDISKQCLDVCTMASEVSRQKVFKVGEVIAEDNSDQVVVTTLADLLDVKKALSQGHSAQLIGSMLGDDLRYVTEKRYGSRFGTVAGGSDHADTLATSLPADPQLQKGKNMVVSHEQSVGPRTGQNKPSSNETKKRMTDGGVD